MPLLFTGLVLNLAANSLSAATSERSAEPSPLIRAEVLGVASYDTLVASLQAKIDRSNAVDQGWFQTLWTWVCYVLHDLLHDPWLVEYVKIEYWTTTADGDKIPVTGLAILPQIYHLPGSVPLLALQHPTQVERKYSPSLFNMTNMWDDVQFTVPFGTLFAQMGFAVVLADYPGMGVNTNAHPYCTESLANSVVDMLRAARDYLAAHPDTYASWNGRLYLTGYSEGGYATLLAARDIQTRYTNEFTVTAVAGLDGPYSLSITMRDVMLNADTNFGSPYFLPYTVNGYDSVYAGCDPVFVFTNAVKYAVPGESNFAQKLQAMCLAGTNTGGEMNALIFKATPYIGPRSILTGAYLSELSNTASVLCQVLASNDACSAWVPLMNMRLFHYPKDDLVPYGNATNAYHAFSQRGAPHLALDAFGADWPLNELIEWLRGKMSSYHGAAAPVAYVKSILWLTYFAGLDQQVVPQAPLNDVDGDDLSDPVLYDENTGNWQILLSNRVRSWRKANPEPAILKPIQIALGGPGFTPILKDFDGDGQADPGVFQTTSGFWAIYLSLFEYAPVIFPLGDVDSTPVPQDYDGDRLADPAVYSRSTGLWTVYLVSSNQIVNIRFGGQNDVAVNITGNCDFDGDHKADLALYEGAGGNWSIALSGNHYEVASIVCGGPGGTPAPGDFDGDGKTDPAIYRETTGDWIVALSASSYAQTLFNFGGPGWLPVVGDYDADGKYDFMVYEENSGIWGSKLSSAGYSIGTGYFGGAGYRPVP